MKLQWSEKCTAGGYIDNNEPMIDILQRTSIYGTLEGHIYRGIC